jgi:hypothetical protein
MVTKNRRGRKKRTVKDYCPTQHLMSEFSAEPESKIDLPESKPEKRQKEPKQQIIQKESKTE